MSPHPESAFKRIPARTERRDRTTAVSTLAAAQNGTSRRAHQPATAYIESDVRTSEAIIQIRRSAWLGALWSSDIRGDVLSASTSISGVAVESSRSRRRG